MDIDYKRIAEEMCVEIFNIGENDFFAIIERVVHHIKADTETALRQETQFLIGQRYDIEIKKLIEERNVTE